jgi:hypothetical protein
MDVKLESILAKKLEEVINQFLKEFSGFGTVDNPNIVKEPTIHKIKLREQMIYLEPSMHEGREYWYNQLHKSVLNFH